MDSRCLTGQLTSGARDKELNTIQLFAVFAVGMVLRCRVHHSFPFKWVVSSPLGIGWCLTLVPYAPRSRRMRPARTLWTQILPSYSTPIGKRVGCLFVGYSTVTAACDHLLSLYNTGPCFDISARGSSSGTSTLTLGSGLRSRSATLICKH